MVGDRAGGAVIERGAEFVLAGYDVMRELAARFGLELADTGMSYYVREPRGVEVDTAALQAAGLARGAAATAGPLGRGGRRVAGSPGGGRGGGARARGDLGGARGRRLSAEVLEHAAAFEPLPSHRIAGGNQRLAEAMAAQLGDRVRLAHARCHALDEIDAEHVVLALPLPALRELALPDWKHAALGILAPIPPAARATLNFRPAHSDLATIIRTAWAWHKAAHPLKSA